MSDIAGLRSTALGLLRQAGISAEDRLLVAFSGGLDSSVLVDILDWARRRGGPAIELVHVDHGLRPDSEDHARFCARQAALRSLPIELERLSFDEPSASQARARRRRLAVIADYALRHNIETVAFGHHGDDRIETFLFHLRRTTGLDGLSSMRPEADYPIDGIDLQILRPLIEGTRAQLRKYAEAHQLPHVVDPTNATDAYARNRIRHHVVPRLVSQSGHRRAILETIEHLAEERRAADHYAARLADSAAMDCAGLRSRTYRRSALAEAPGATVARLFQHLEPTLDARAIDEILSQLRRPRSNSPRHLTLSRCVITVVGERVVFEPSYERGGRDVLKRRAHPINLLPFERGEAPFFGATLHWGLVDFGDQDRFDEPSTWRASFDAACLRRPLQMTGARAGARLLREKNDGSTYHQKLSDLFRTFGVDADLRWRWPCLYDESGELLWAAGLRHRCANFRASEDTKRWYIEVTPSREMTEILQP